ncbi:ribonuclease H-like domain-containing protein, partial [Tanacetum coccineum]
MLDGSCRRSNVDEVLGRQWDRVNPVVLGWILNSITEELFLGQIFSKRARHVWEELRETYDKVDGSVTFNLHHKIHTMKQNGSTLADYYHNLNALWKQFDCLVELPRCTCHAAVIFLSRDPLPDVRNAYATISSEESHRVIASSMSDSSQRTQTAAFASNAPNRTVFQRGQSSNSSFRPNNSTNPGPRPNNNNQSRTNLGVWKRNGQNSKGKSVSNNSVSGSSSSSGFTDEQLSTLITLIKDNSVSGKSVQANMAGANQHMTDSDKGLYNVHDISHLKIKVGHPNGTETFISKIGTLKLKNGLILYDMLFVESGFESKKFSGIGNQCGGLYYLDSEGMNCNKNDSFVKSCLSQHDWHCRLGHPADPVLSVLKPDLKIDNTKQTEYCENLSEGARQTRESFHLSDHTYCLNNHDKLGRRSEKCVNDGGFISSVKKGYRILFLRSQNLKIDVCQDVNHLKFFDLDYPEIPSDDNEIDPSLNNDSSNHSDSSHSHVSGENNDIIDIPDSGVDADNNGHNHATHDEQ